MIETQIPGLVDGQRTAKTDTAVTPECPTPQEGQIDHLEEVLVPTRVGWVEAIAETHHNPRRRMMGFALLYPSYSGNGGKRMEEYGLPVDR
jgi:hypothetical protein